MSDQDDTNWNAIKRMNTNSILDIMVYEVKFPMEEVSKCDYLDEIIT